MMLFVGFSSSSRGAEAPAIVPKPQEMNLRDGQFELTPQSRICIADESLKPIGEYLASHLKAVTGHDLTVENAMPAPNGDILLLLRLAIEGSNLS